MNTVVLVRLVAFLLAAVCFYTFWAFAHARRPRPAQGFFYAGLALTGAAAGTFIQ